MKPCSERETYMTGNIHETKICPVLTDKDQARQFLGRLQYNIDEPALVIQNPLMKNPADRVILLLSVMRDKSPEEFESVVQGLWNIADGEKFKNRKKELENYASVLMELGTLLYDIDWS